ncbi:hypothetical protein [Agromyces intestinalis]|uniref:hypothetical protein n=1 Tax=Agromyces intestinalis TaxID=2592652 RepID=UPI001AEF66B5|nr:hypothetical protein [Agromyces intestinalis]
MTTTTEHAPSPAPTSPRSRTARPALTSRTALAWLVGVGLVAAAWVVALVTPGADAVQSPFPVEASIGERVEGRNLAVTVTDVRAAEEVEIDGWSAEGTWIVVDLEAEAVVTEEFARLALATIEQGGRTFSASERPTTSLRNSELSVGVPRAGALAFEVPADVLDGGPATLRLGLDPDSRLDSVIELRFDPGGLDVEASVAVAPTEWARS